MRHQPTATATTDRLRPGVRRRASARPEPMRPLHQVLLDARVVAVVLGVLAGLGLLGATLSFTVDLFVAPWRIFTADVEESLHLAASLIGLAGAFQLYRGAPRGRPVVLAGLALNVAATLYFSPGTLGTADTLVPMVTWVGLAVLTLVCQRPPAPVERPWWADQQQPDPGGPQQAPPGYGAGYTGYPWPPPRP